MQRIVIQLSLLATAAIIASGCAGPRHNLPPEQRLLEPGPGVGGPGPGVLGPPAYAPGMVGAVIPTAAVGAMPMETAPPAPPSPTPAAPVDGDSINAPLSASTAQPGSGEVDLVNYQNCGPGGYCGPGGGCFGGHAGLGSNIPAGGGVLTNAGLAGIPPTVQVTFGQPDGMQVRYDATGAGMFDSEPLVVPARQNFPQGGLYRIKLTNIVAREGVELYPTIELAFANPRTGAFLAHNSIPIQFTEEDFDQVLTGNFVTKVIYLPDPEFQGPALAGIDTLVSTRLDPGIDPIVEADRRGSILAIIRLGDKDIEMSGVGGGVIGAGGVMSPAIAGLPAAFAPAMTAGCGPCGSCGSAGCNNSQCVGMPPSLPGMVAGVTAPQYGMPMSGTPIGLPGPPHIPLGAPAGLKKHVIKNHTPMHIPQPVKNMKMHVRLQPGFSYPNPVSRVRITEQNVHPGVPHARGHYQHASQRVDPYCEP